MANILIVEDEISISKMIAFHLKIAGYNYFQADATLKAKEIIKSNRIDLILLDVMLPGENGFSFSTYIKAKNIPFIYLTAKTDIQDRIRGLNLGAEDYIIKPFEPDELLARINVVLRRQGNVNNKYVDDIIEIDFDSRIVLCNGNKIELTATEFDLLSILVINKSIAMSRESLLKTVWDFESLGETRTVDVHLQRLRKKLGVDVIETVFKYGYKYIGNELKCKES